MNKVLFKISKNNFHLPDDYITEYIIIDELPINGFIDSDGMFNFKNEKFNILNEDQFNIKIANNRNLLIDHLTKMRENNKKRHIEIINNYIIDGYI